MLLEVFEIGQLRMHGEDVCTDTIHARTLQCLRGCGQRLDADLKLRIALTKLDRQTRLRPVDLLLFHAIDKSRHIAFGGGSEPTSIGFNRIEPILSGIVQSLAHGGFHADGTARQVDLHLRFGLS